VFFEAVFMDEGKDCILQPEDKKEERKEVSE
jgi:hypothetical protein